MNSVTETYSDDVIAGFPSDPSVTTAAEWEARGSVWLPPRDIARFRMFVPRNDDIGLPWAASRAPFAFNAAAFFEWTYAEFGIDLSDMVPPNEVARFAHLLGDWLVRNPEGPVLIGTTNTGLTSDHVRSLQFFVEISVRQNLWWRPVPLSESAEW